jgi:hypothetical protein
LAILEAWLTLSEEDGQRTPGDDEGESNSGKDENDDDQYGEREDSVLWGHHSFVVLPQGNFPVLDAIIRVLIGRGDHDRLAGILANHLEREEDPRVWQALLHYFIYFRPTVENVRTELLSRLFARFPVLLPSTEAVFVLAHAQWWAPDLVRDTLAVWPTERLRARQTYGELMGLVALSQPDLTWARDALETIVTQPDRQPERTGAALSAVNLWREGEQRERSTDLLVRLIPQADRALWAAVFSVFRVVDELTPEPQTVRLLRAIAEHVTEAGPIASTYVVDRLQTLLPHEAPLVATIAEGLIKCWREELGDIRTGTAMAAGELIDLAVTLHRLGSETREAGTRIFESLLMIDAYKARQTLDEIDSRFRPTAPVVRPRLPRRATRARRRLRA